MAMGQVEARSATTASAIGSHGLLIGAALAAAGAAAVKMSIDFNRGLANVDTLLGGNRVRIEEFRGDIERLSISTGKAVGDLTDGLYQVVSAFGDSADSAARLEIAARASVAGLSSTTEAINLLSAVSKGYGDTSVEMLTHISDLSFETVRLGQTTFPELASSIGQITPVAAAMGVKIKELFASYATLTGVTGSTAEVTTQLRSIMSGFQRQTEGMSAALRTLGVTSVEAFVGEHGLVGALRRVIGTTDGSIESITRLFRRVEGLPAVLALSSTQADVFDTKLGELGDAAGATDTAFRAQTEGVNSLGHSLDIMKQRIAELARMLGDTLVASLTDTVGAIGGMVGTVAGIFGAVKEAWDKLPAPVKMMLGGGGGGAGEGPVTGVVAAQRIADSAAGQQAIVQGWVNIFEALDHAWDPLLADLAVIERSLGFVAQETDGLSGAQERLATATFVAGASVAQMRPVIEGQASATLAAASATLGAALASGRLTGAVRLLHRGTEDLTESELAARDAWHDLLQAGIPRDQIVGTEEWAARLEKVRETAQRVLYVFETLEGVRTRSPHLFGPSPAEMTLFDELLRDLNQAVAITEALQMGWAWRGGAGAGFFDTVNVGADVLNRLSSSYGKAIKDGAKIGMADAEPGMADSFADAFVSGFGQALHNIGDLWKAFCIGLGDALGAVLTQQLTAALEGYSTGSMWAKLLGSIGGALFGSVFNAMLSATSALSDAQIAAGYNTGPTILAPWEQAFRPPWEPERPDFPDLVDGLDGAAADLTLSAEDLKAAAETWQDVGDQIMAGEAGVLSAIFDRLEGRRELRGGWRELEEHLAEEYEASVDPSHPVPPMDLSVLRELIAQLSGPRNVITAEEWQIIRGRAKEMGLDTRAMDMLRDIVEGINAKALLNTQIRQNERQIDRLRETRNALQRYLPQIRDYLRTIAGQGGGGGNGDGNGDGGPGDDELPPPKTYQYGGTVATTGLAYLHAGETVTPAGGDGAARDPGPSGGDVYLDGDKVGTWMAKTLDSRVRNQRADIRDSAVRYRGR